MSDSIRKAILDYLCDLRSEGSNRDIVSLGLVSTIFVGEGRIYFSVFIPEKGDFSYYELLRQQIEDHIKSQFPDYFVAISLTRDKKSVSSNVRNEIKKVICVASGKGGVGKSTVSINLALALKGRGLRVGLLDADIYGPSLLHLTGLQGQKISSRSADGAKKEISLVEKFGIKLMSIGFFIEEEKPILWRGPMIMGALKQMLEDVHWGALDILVIDMPPGTGDIALSLAQKGLPLYSVIVSTPQDLALIDVRKAISMYQKMEIPILGLIENMSYFIAPDTGNYYDIFGEGKVELEAQRRNINFLGKIPLDSRINDYCNRGLPIVLDNTQKIHQEIYEKIACSLISLLSL